MKLSHFGDCEVQGACSCSIIFSTRVPGRETIVFCTLYSISTALVPHPAVGILLAGIGINWDFGCSCFRTILPPVSAVPYKYCIPLESSFHEDSDSIRYLIIGSLVVALQPFKHSPSEKKFELLQSGKNPDPTFFYGLYVASSNYLIPTFSRTLDFFPVGFNLWWQTRSMTCFCIYVTVCVLLSKSGFFNVF